MNDTQQTPCNCATCPAAGCLCGCQQPAAQSASPVPCACGTQCPCGPNCSCARA